MHLIFAPYKNGEVWDIHREKSNLINVGLIYKNEVENAHITETIFE
jgi:hypothetical protein